MSGCEVKLTLEYLAARIGVYRLLAVIWQRELCAEFLQELREPPLSRAFVSAGGVLPGADPRVVEQLAIDYCQLFVGPIKHLPPLQSVWQTGQLQGPSAESMKRFCEIVGYGTDQRSDGLMFDHLGVQLDVMAHILDHCSVLQGEQLDSALELGRYFYAKHLRWPTDLLDAAEHQAATDFYRAAVRLTRNFLNSENSCTEKGEYPFPTATGSCGTTNRTNNANAGQ